MRSLSFVFVAALVLAMSVPAAAQRRDLGKIVEEAKTAFDEGNFVDAALLLEEAYEIQPIPDFVWNTARAYEKAGQWDLAEINYTRYSELDITDEERAAARERMARYAAARQIPKALGSARAGAELDTLRASNRQLRERGGSATDDTAEPVESTGGATMWEMAGWGGVGVGALLLGTAATLHFASIGTVEEFNQTAADGRDQAKYDALKDTLNTRVVTSQVLVIGGTLLAAAGGTLLYFEYFADDGGETAFRLSPAVGADGGGFVLEGSF